MLKPITVTAEFTWEPEIDGYCIGTFDCRATADVRPGESAKPWLCDPGCGPEIENFRDIEVEGVKFNGKTGEDRAWERKWFTPHDTLRDWILKYLETGAVDMWFEEAAHDAGGRADYERALLAENH